MELIPTLEIGWLNGWMLLGFEFLIQGLLLLVFPKDVVARLFDRSGWSGKQKVFTIIGKVFSLACLVLIVLTPLKINSSAFHRWVDFECHRIGWSHGGYVELQRYSAKSASDERYLQNITPSPNSGAIYHIFRNMYSDRFMDGSFHPNNIQVVSAFWDNGRGRGMFEAIW